MPGLFRRTLGGTAAARWLPALALALAVLAYLPSLPGGWVWDDWYQVARNPGLSDPLALLTADVWSPTGLARSDLYRPLFMLAFWPGQALLPGPTVERLFSLAIHLGAVLCVARLGRALGAGTGAAALAAALFGVHPAATEAVAWISARCDLAPAALYLLAWWLWLRGRHAGAGLLLALCPFFKESWLVAPLAAGAWMLGARRPTPSTLLVAVAGGGAYLLARTALELPIPSGAAGVAVLPAAGGTALRLAELLCVPLAPDAFPVLRPSPALGAVALLCGVMLLALSWGRPWVAGLSGAALSLAPSALASAHVGLVGDRYAYALLGPLALGLAVALGSRRPPRWAWALPLGLAVLTAARTADWTSDERLFSASFTKDPANPYAAFHLAYDLHTRRGDCAAAVPLYRQGLTVDERAGTNLLACLVQVGRNEEAAALGQDLARARPDHAGLAANTARALAALGRAEDAEAWCRRALAQAPGRCDLAVMLGNLLGQQGRLDEAEAAFQTALGTPCAADAERGLAAVAAGRE